MTSSNGSAGGALVWRATRADRWVAPPQPLFAERPRPEARRGRGGDLEVAIDALAAAALRGGVARFAERLVAADLLAGQQIRARAERDAALVGAAGRLARARRRDALRLGRAEAELDERAVGQRRRRILEA